MEEKKAITKEQIDTLFEGAVEQMDYIVGYYKMLYGEETWENVAQIDDYAHAGSALSDYFMEKAVAWDRAHLSTDILPGGAMLNYGPSVDHDLDPWQASVPRFIPKEVKNQ